jgi:hypothetical protein
LRTRRISNSAAIGFGIEHNFQVITDRIEHRIGEREMFYRSSNQQHRNDRISRSLMR